MPYISETIRLQGLQDRRRKLTDEQKLEIQKQYATGNWSLSKLGAAFGVSKKTVLLLVNPDSAEKAKEYRKENWKEFQPTREERNRITREHRHYKQQLYLSGQLTREEKNNDTARTNCQAELSRKHKNLLFEKL